MIYLCFCCSTKVCVTSEGHNMLNDLSRKWRTCWCMRVYVCVHLLVENGRHGDLLQFFTDWSGQWAASSGKAFTLLHKRIYLFIHYRASYYHFKAVYSVKFPVCELNKVLMYCKNTPPLKWCWWNFTLKSSHPELQPYLGLQFQKLHVLHQTKLSCTLQNRTHIH